MNRPYGVGDGEGEVLLSFFVVSVDDFLVVVEDFFMSSFFMSVFLVMDFFVVVEVLAGAVVDVSVLLVLQEARSPAASMTVME